jgi:hypothetical protein
LIRVVGFIDDELEGNMAETYAPLPEGRCMTCHAELGKHTVLFVNVNGIVAGYCGGACAQDMAVMGWLQEQHDDIVDAVKFRGGAGDKPEQ